MSKGGLTNQAVRGLSWMVIGKFSGAIFRIVFVSILAHTLLVEDFGIFQTAMILISLADRLTQIGLGPALVQFKVVTKSHIATSLMSALVLGLFLTLVTYLIAPYWTSFMGISEHTTMMYVLAWIFPIKKVATVSVSLLQRDMQFSLISIIELIAFIFGYGALSIFFAKNGFGYWSIVYGLLAQTIIESLLFLAFKLRSLSVGFNWTDFKKLAGFGGGVTLANLFNWVALRGDNLIISKELGTVSLGIYGRAYNIMTSSVSLFGSALDKVISSAMSKKQDEKDKLKIAYFRGIGLSASVIFPLSIVAIIIADPLIHTLLGGKFVEAILPFQILSTTMAFRVGYKVSGAVAKAVGQVYNNALNQVYFAILVVVFVYCGQLWYGLPGASAGVALSILSHYILAIGMVKGILKNISWLEVLKCHLPAALMGGVFGITAYLLVVLSAHMGIPDWGVLLLVPAVVVIVSLLLLVINARLFYGESGIWLSQVIMKLLSQNKFMSKIIKSNDKTITEEK